MQLNFGKREFSFFPQTFVLPSDFKLLKRAFEDGSSRQKWIVKPVYRNKIPSLAYLDCLLLKKCLKKNATLMKNNRGVMTSVVSVILWIPAVRNLSLCRYIFMCPLSYKKCTSVYRSWYSQVSKIYVFCTYILVYLHEGIYIYIHRLRGSSLIFVSLLAFFKCIFLCILLCKHICSEIDGVFSSCF